jgi:hypothetical protein
VSVVSLAAVKATLDVSSAAHDAELQEILDEAEVIIGVLVGPLAPVTVIDEVHTGPGPLLLKQHPVMSVSSATNDGVAVSDVDLDAHAGVLYGSFGSGRRGVRVTYVTGRDLSPDLRRAVLELVRHLWETQRGNSPAGMALRDPDERTLQGVSSYLLPYRVQTLIEPYLIPTVA